jgi:hypothetical protein
VAGKAAFLFYLLFLNIFLPQESARGEQELSSLVWICTSTHSVSKVGRRKAATLVGYGKVMMIRYDTGIFWTRNYAGSGSDPKVAN